MEMEVDRDEYIRLLADRSRCRNELTALQQIVRVERRIQVNSLCCGVLLDHDQDAEFSCSRCGRVYTWRPGQWQEVTK